MKIYKEIPFYENTPDNTHCYQAALKMVLKHFFPKEDYSFEELEKITMKVEGLWTWPTASMLWIRQKGLGIKIIETFDYEKFILEGSQYLINEYGQEVGAAQIRNSNIKQEIALAKKFFKVINIEKRIPTIHDIKNLSADDYVIIVSINARTLNSKEGYSSHSVVIKGIDDNQVILNDPGFPGSENRKVDFELFEKAWAYPNEKAKNIIALRLNAQ